MFDLTALTRAIRKKVGEEADREGRRPDAVEVGFTADMNAKGDLVINQSRRSPGPIAVTMKFGRQATPPGVRILADYAASLATGGRKKNVQKRLNAAILYRRQDGYCEGCNLHFPPRNLTIDHIVPESHGGGGDIANLQLLCHACNWLKADGTQEQLVDKLREQEDDDTGGGVPLR